MIEDRLGPQIEGCGENYKFKFTNHKKWKLYNYILISLYGMKSGD